MGFVSLEPLSENLHTLHRKIDERTLCSVQSYLSLFFAHALVTKLFDSALPFLLLVRSGVLELPEVFQLSRSEKEHSTKTILKDPMYEPQMNNLQHGKFLDSY